MRSSPALLSLLVSFVVCSAAAAQDSGELEASKYTPASPLQRRAPVYPSGALSSRKEGWVMMSFVISPTGDVTEPMIEDSSGVEAFERAALRAVEGWKYTPAMEDGEPVEQAMVKTRIQFQIEEQGRGASPAFTSKYRRIAALLNEGDFAAAEPLIAELEFGERANLYEDAWFWWTKYVLEARALDISAAIATFERLRDAKTARRADVYDQVIANLQPSYEKMLEFVRGEQLLIVDGKIGEYDYWVHDLLRRSFSIVDVVGRLDALDIRCTRGTRRYSSVPVDTVWTVPESWQDCGIS